MLEETVTARKVFDTFFDKSKPLALQAVQLDVLCDYLRSAKSSEALTLSCELLLAGVDSVVVAISFIARHGENRAELDW